MKNDDVEVIAISLDAIRTVLALASPSRKSSEQYTNLLESVPFTSNYLIEQQTFFRGKRILEPLEGHRRSAIIKIREHIGLPNIKAFCEIGLSEEQVGWLKYLDDQHIIKFPGGNKQNDRTF